MTTKKKQLSTPSTGIAEQQRQCGLVLDLAKQNIEELYECATDTEEYKRADDLMKDLKEITPLILSVAELLNALKQARKMILHYTNDLIDFGSDTITKMEGK